MRTVLVLGGGLAGLAASVALGQSGFRVILLEARPFLGGRAASYPVPGVTGESEEAIDNCQHILLRCCVNLMDLYRRLGVSDAIEFHREFYWIEPGGRVSTMRRGVLPSPLHFSGSFARLRFLSLQDKVAIGSAMLSVIREHGKRADLDRITMLDWLKEKGQPKQAIERFWRQVLVSAINEDLERMAAAHGLQVMWLGFLARGDSYEMGIPRIPLGELYSAPKLREWNVDLELRTPVTAIHLAGDRVSVVEAGGRSWEADHVISALPFERLVAVGGDVPGRLGLKLDEFDHSPITGIHLWFDHSVTELPHGTLLDRNIQWFYSREGGRYLKLVVSASRAFTTMERQEIIDLSLGELREFLPGAREARVEKAHVVKEVRATFSARPGLEALRPEALTRMDNFTLAGDWTRTGWPATMEGAVRSGYRAAEVCSAAFGVSSRYLQPDIA